MQISKPLSALLIATTITRAEPNAINFKDLQASLPTEISYGELATYRYQQLGFTQAEITEIFASKAQIRTAQQDWPTLGSFDQKIPVEIAELPTGVVGEHRSGKVRIAVDLVKGRPLEVEEVLVEELLHAIQQNGDNPLNYAFIPDAVAQQHLDKLIFVLKFMDQKLRDKKIDLSELNLENANEAAKKYRAAALEKKVEREALFLLHFNAALDQNKLPDSDLYEFAKESSDPAWQIAKLKEINAPQVDIDKATKLAVGMLELSESAQLIQQRFGALASFKKYLSTQCYGFVKWEIDARLSAMNYHWMKHQHSEGLKPQPILTKEGAQTAFDWFIKQTYEEGTVPELQQRYLKMLLDNFSDPNQKKKILDQLLERACGLTNIEKTTYENIA